MSRTHTVPLDPDLVDFEAKRTFHSRLVLGIGAVALVVLVAIAWPVSHWLGKDERLRVDARLSDAAALAAMRVDRYLGDHERLMTVLASSPSVVDGARAASARWRNEGLAGLSRLILAVRDMADPCLLTGGHDASRFTRLRSVGGAVAVISV